MQKIRAWCVGSAASRAIPAPQSPFQRSQGGWWLEELHFEAIPLINTTTSVNAPFCGIHSHENNSFRGIGKDCLGERNLVLEYISNNTNSLSQLISEEVLPVWWEGFIALEEKNDKNLIKEREYYFSFVQEKVEKREQEHEQQLSRVTTKMRVWWQRLWV